MGWCIGPALEHYRCYKVFVTETTSERIDDVVEFTHQNLIIPRVSYADTSTLVAQDLVQELKNQMPNSHFTTISDIHHTESINLSE